MAAADEDDLEDGPCEYWDEDGCYCVCGSGCSCRPFHPSTRVVNVGDELHRILGEALAKANGDEQSAREEKS